MRTSQKEWTDSANETSELLEEGDDNEDALHVEQGPSSKKRRGIYAALFLITVAAVCLYEMQPPSSTPIVGDPKLVIESNADDEGECPVYWCSDDPEAHAIQIPSNIGTKRFEKNLYGIGVHKIDCYFRKPEMVDHEECETVRIPLCNNPRCHYREEKRCTTHKVKECVPHFGKLGAGFYGWTNPNLHYYCPNGQGSLKIGIKGTITTPSDENKKLYHFANIYPAAVRPENHVKIEDGVKLGSTSFDVLITKAWVHVWPQTDIDANTKSREADVDVTWTMPTSYIGGAEAWGNKCTCGHCETSRGF